MASHSPASAAFTDALPAPAARPRITRKGVAIAAVLWTLYALAFAVPLARASGLSLQTSFAYQLQFDLLLALYSIPVWLLVVRAMDERPWTQRLAAHLVLAPLYVGLGVQTLVVLSGGMSAYVAEHVAWIVISILTVYVGQFALYHTVRAVQRLRHRERQAIELMALAKERELAVLKAQVNPHFLFNTLNSISAMVTRDPEQSREMIARLAELLRYALASARHDLVPLEEEVRFARAYLGLEAHRFSDRLRVRFDVDPDALATPVPPMVLQPLVENAVKHGIAPREAGGEVAVCVRLHDGELRVSVEDTGAGPPPAAAAASNGIGLANTSARLERRFGPGSALHTEPLAPHGFRVSFRVPAPFPGTTGP